MSKVQLTVIGFICFILGASSLVLSLVGVNLSFMTWVDWGGRSLGFLIRLVLLISGIAFVAVANTDWDGEASNEDF